MLKLFEILFSVFFFIINTILDALKIFNVLSVIVGAIWLAVIGDWIPIAIGVVISFSAVHFLRFLFSFRIGLLWEDIFCGKPSGLKFVIVHLGEMFFSMGIPTLWCIGVLLLFFLPQLPEGGIIPRLLVAYGLSTGSFALVFSGGAIDSLSFRTIFFVGAIQLSFIAMMVYGVFFTFDLHLMTVLFSRLTLLALLIEISRFFILIFKFYKQKN